MAYLAVLNKVGNQNGLRPELDCYSTTAESWAECLSLVPKNLRIWLPFYMNGDSGRIVRSLGYNVIESPPIEMGGDFYKYEPDPASYDLIIDNPPFSKKDKLLERFHKINKPFIIFYPFESLLQIGVRKMDRKYKYSLLMTDKYFTFKKGGSVVKNLKNIVLYCYNRHPDWNRLKLPVIADRVDYISNYYSQEYIKIEKLFESELDGLLTALD